MTNHDKIYFTGVLAVLSAVFTPSCAFSMGGAIRLTITPRGLVELSALSTPQDAAVVTPSSRRNFLRDFATATSTAAGVAAAVASCPFPAFAEEEAPVKSKARSLDKCLYSILRAREATFQEIRLIKSGKFKDVQRANVKLAAKFILNNYQLSDCIIAGSAYLGSNRLQATNVGQSAVQSLYTILEYFDSSDVENIKVGSDSMAGKETLVIRGLESVGGDLDEYIGYFPADVVNASKAKIKMENELNFQEFDPTLGTILNPNP